MCQKPDEQKRECRGNDDDFMDESICVGLGCCWEYENDPTIAPACFCNMINIHLFIFHNIQTKFKLNDNEDFDGV